MLAVFSVTKEELLLKLQDAERKAQSDPETMMLKEELGKFISEVKNMKAGEGKPQEVTFVTTGPEAFKFKQSAKNNSHQR